ncbi:hypothetical protein ACNFU2_10965 [Chryseobacterium sp. PTM-20240506]|uniref:hypothetical protein n=1 Tax=unclassified Chryseobacterium TaxID=2593645 RepID=UPI00235815EA|nr:MULTISPECIES: hypothetical protein [unclassified Chryseobacterium]MDC8105416.1 hypothetical protein [Chryseobacterium sp. B21-037]MDQ1805671.1 hypothetical protein [Chryseobacterium sp. CKR4-1]
MKTIIIMCCLVVLWVYMYYPVFDSEGISYFIIFSCFTVLCFSIAKIYSSDTKTDYESIEKETDRLEKLDGNFKYTADGFYHKHKNQPEFIRWDEIVSVYSFSIPFFDDRQTGLEIITDKNQYEFDQEIPGITKLTHMLEQNLPDWDSNAPTLRINNYGLEKAKLYERKI